MLTYPLDPQQKKPLYEQLCDFLRNDIRIGTLSPGDHLPSKRTLAAHLSISTITVENAYHRLMDEGYLTSIPKKGYFVARLSKRFLIPPQEKPSAAFYETFPNDTPPKDLSEHAALPFDAEPAKEPLIFDLSENRTAPQNFPFTVWAKLLRETISSYPTELMTPPPSGGIWELRLAIAHHLYSFRGMRVSPEQILIGAGTEYLYELLLKLLGRDQIYGVEEPGHKKITQIYESNEVRSVPIALDSQGLSPAELLSSGADIVHLSPTHHFPTGITMPLSRRYELLAWAGQKEGRYIIEDDYDSEFRLTGKPLPSLQSIDSLGRVLYMNTFSKSLSSTIRISYLVLPVPLLVRFHEKLGFTACTVSNFEQYTLARFIGDGYFEKHISRMRLFYNRQRAAVLSAIKQSALHGRCDIIEHDSGLHFLLHIKTPLSDKEAYTLLLSHRIRLLPLSFFYRNDGPAHIFLLNYSNLDVTHLPEILDQIAKMLLVPPSKKIS